MSERYARLFTLPENLYATGSPVLIAAGTLLKDNHTSTVLAQLKLRNIGANPIKAATVSIQPFDTVGNSLGDAIAFQYLDLNIYRSGEFGSKIPIALPNSYTRSYSVSVTEVIFADNTIWKTNNEPWNSLDAPITLERSLKDQELVKQYRLKFGGDCKYEPTVQKDLWYCSCGELNRKYDAVCNRCQRTVSALVSVDLNDLKNERDTRIAVERQKADEEKAAAEAKAKKTKILAIIFTPIVVVLIIISVLICNTIKNKMEEAARLEAYHAAISMVEAGQYDEALTALSALGDYRDSVEKLHEVEAIVRQIKEDAEREAIYNSALSELSKGHIERAYELFQKLGEYKDAALYQLVFLVSEEVYTNQKYNIRQTTRYQYNNELQLIRSTYYATSKSNDEEVTEYFYDNDGNMTSVSEDYWMYDASGKPLKEYPSIDTATYNEHGDIITGERLHDQIMPDGTRQHAIIYTYSYTYEYNDDKTMASKSYILTCDKIQSDNTYETSTIEYSYAYEYTYDEDGRILTCKEYNKNNSDTVLVSEYFYDAFGNIVSIKTGDNETNFEYNSILVKKNTN